MCKLAKYFELMVYKTRGYCDPTAPAKGKSWVLKALLPLLVAFKREHNAPKPI